MAGYSARRAPNVSEYIANLNTVPSVHDLEAQQQEGYSLEDDLATFTNADFYDFDLGSSIEQPPINYDPSQEERARRENVATKRSKINNDMNRLDINSADFQFPELDSFLSPSSTDPIPIQSTFPNQPFNLSKYPDPTSPFANTPQIPSKRPFSSASPSSPADSSNLEASSRAAAEEDKRRRNTAASARFRVKKKQREQALEKTAKEMTDRADALEAKIEQLEMENKWLKNLFMEKTANKDDVAGLWKKFTKENERRSEGAKKGVGTNHRAGSASST